MNNLSVVLCTYNEEKFIEKTLVNLIKDDIVKEIIIVDDNSNDRTINIIERIKSDKIKLFIRKDVRGFASALNLGISKASERYILRFDVDMFSEIEWKELYSLSEDTFVEENESLKKNAAGAGLNDND